MPIIIEMTDNDFDHLVNIVHTLACGHEWDDVETLPIGHLINCSQHGLTMVVSSL